LELFNYSIFELQTSMVKDQGEAAKIARSLQSENLARGCHSHVDDNGHHPCSWSTRSQ